MSLETTREVSVAILGVGGVGGALLRQILENREWHRDQFDLFIRIVGICDSQGMVGLSGSPEEDQFLREVLICKENGGSLTDVFGSLSKPDFNEMVQPSTGGPKIVVDCTAEDSAASALLAGLEHGCKVVMANKKPMTSDQDQFDRFHHAGLQGRCRWEATVGAGLPVMVTLERFRKCGDPILLMSGTLSGTLGLLMSGLQEGRRFSELVGEAKAAGYTEPDPRDDLGGMDVARKALILARMLGWRVELEDVQLKGLFPEEMSSLAVEEFLGEIRSLDEEYAALAKRAGAENKALRYAATIAEGQCKVGMEAFSVHHPLGQLVGVDQLLAIHSRWYDPLPLVIQGRGAGADATAAGVFSDIVELATH